MTPSNAIRQLVEKCSGHSSQEPKEEFGGGASGADGCHICSIRTIIPHELERMEEVLRLEQHEDTHEEQHEEDGGEEVTHGTKNPLSFGKNLNTAVENKWIIVVLLGVGDNRR